MWLKSLSFALLGVVAIAGPALADQDPVQRFSLSGMGPDGQSFQCAVSYSLSTFQIVNREEGGAYFTGWSDCYYGLTRVSGPADVGIVSTSSTVVHVINEYRGGVYTHISGNSEAGWTYELCSDQRGCN